MKSSKPSPVVLKGNEDAAADLRAAWRGSSAIRRSQPRNVPFNPDMSTTSVSSGATISCFAENAAVQLSEQTFAEVPLLNRKRLTGMIHVTAMDIATGTHFRDALARELARREEQALLGGDGHPGGPTNRFSEPARPLGLLHTKGITQLPIPGLSIDSLRRARAVYRSLNVGRVRLALLISHDLFSRFLTMDGIERVIDGDSARLAWLPAPVFGNFDGVPYATTDALTADDGLIFVNSAEWILADSSEFELTVANAVTTFDGERWHPLPPDEILIAVSTDHDHFHRRPNQVVHVAVEEHEPAALAV